LDRTCRREIGALHVIGPVGIYVHSEAVGTVSFGGIGTFPGKVSGHGQTEDNLIGPGIDLGVDNVQLRMPSRGLARMAIEYIPIWVLRRSSEQTVPPRGMLVLHLGTVKTNAEGFDLSDLGDFVA
jgi:hypothetical protein